MSFDSMKRSNNRHNFISKAEHGMLPSQSPFVKSEADILKEHKSNKTTAVKWSEVNPDVRLATAKQELRLKLKARHSTTHQVVTAAPEPGTVGNVHRGLHPIDTSIAEDEESEGGGGANTLKDVSRTKAVSQTASAAAIIAQAPKNPREADSGGSRVRRLPSAGGLDRGNDGGNSSDEEGTTDVYGWRFDKDGDEENDKHLSLGLAGSAEGENKASASGANANAAATSSSSSSSSSSSPVAAASLGERGMNFIKAAHSSSKDLLQSARASFTSKMQGVAQTFTPTEEDHPVLRSVKSLSQFAGSTLLKTASFAAKAAVKISSKLVEDIGQWASQDEADQLGTLLERNDSYMKIHDLANSPTKDRAKQKRLAELHGAISEMRQFGEEAEHHRAAQDEKLKRKEKSIVHAAETALHNLAFHQGGNKHAALPSPTKVDKPPPDHSLLGLADYAITFSPDSEAPPEGHYRTLLDIKDMSNFHDQYYSATGKGLPPMTGRELHKASLRPEAAAAAAATGRGGAGPESVHSTTSTMATSLKSQPQQQQQQLAAPTSGLPSMVLAMTAANRIKSPLKKGISFAGTPAQPDWDMGRGPGGGLPPLRGSSYREPPKVVIDDDHTPGYIKRLRATGSFLKEQFSKAKEHLTAKLPRLESAPELRLETGKERIPPMPTSTNGFARAGPVDAGSGTGAAGEGGSGDAAVDDDGTGGSGGGGGGGKTPFSLLTKAMRASSFVSGLKLTGAASSPTAKTSLKPYESSPNLSERHRRMMQDASPGLGLPVIYAPAATRSEVSEESLYSHVTSLTNMLEVSDGQKGGRFRPSNVNHLDLSRVTEVPGHEHDDLTSVKRIAEASDVGPDLPEKEIGNGWKACWDFEAGSVYYFNTLSGEATWLPPSRNDLAAEGEGAGEGTETEDKEGEHFFRVMNNGLPRGLSELNMGDSDLTIKTRKIAARHNLFSKLRSRYEGDMETEFTKGMMAKEYADHAVAEETEILKDYGKELDGWD